SYCVSSKAQSDDKIILGGYSYNTTGVSDSAQVSIIRISNNGSIDTSFGENGLFKLNRSPELFGAMCVALQSDGKIIAAGKYSNNSPTRLFATRITNEGKLDSTFANNGVFINPFSELNSSDVVTSCVIQDDQKILIGFNTTQTSSNNFVFGLLRLNPNGFLDNGFGVDGIVKTDVPIYNYEYSTSVKVQNDGKIIIGGDFSYTNGITAQHIARLNTDGSLDTLFGNTGIDTLNISTGQDVINDMVLLEDGKIFLVGRSGSNACIIRLHSNGQIDSTFNHDGILNFGNSNGNIFTRAELLSPTKLLAGGILKDSNNLPQLGVAAYDFNLFSGIEDAGGMQEAASIYPNPSRNSIQFKQAPVSFNMSVCDLT
ncbi:MAG: hypothetical protein ACK5CO_06095, partial [Bacteroidota bacterium]